MAEALQEGIWLDPVLSLYNLIVIYYINKTMFTLKIDDVCN